MKFTKGVHHVALTVYDLEKTVHFFTQVLGYNKVGEKQDYPAVFVSDGVTMMTLWKVKQPEQVVRFDRRNTIGLHHLALTVDPANLEELHQKLLTTEGCEVEFAPEDLGGGPTRHMMCTIPGSDIRVEFTAPAA